MTIILSDRHRRDIAQRAIGNGVEIEVRFGKFLERRQNTKTGKWMDPKFKSEVGRSHVFRAVLRYMHSLGTVTVQEIEDERWSNGVRVRWNKTKKTTDWIYKAKRQPVDIHAYNIRVGIATETPTEKIYAPPDAGVRKITRYSVRVGNFIFDLSRVRAKYTNHADSVTTFEFEIEIHPDALLNTTLFDDLDKHIQNAFKIVHGTDYLYTANELEEVNIRVNEILGQGKIPPEYPDTEYNHPRKTFLFRQYYNDARNLRRPDMVDGGLVGKPNQVYKVTDKADGLRRFLHFNKYGVWIVSTDSYNLIYRANMVEWQGFLLEGEYIPPNDPNSPTQTRLTIDGVYIQPEHARPHVMYLYDALSNNSAGYTLQNEPHSTRMLACQTIVDTMGKMLPMIYLESKVFYKLSFETMYGLIKQCLTKELPYERDGLMFVPENSPYDVWREYKNEASEYNATRTMTGGALPPPRSILPRLHTRVLTDAKSDDICKWKPANMLTIDLRVTFANDIVELWTEKERVPRKFLGSKRYPITWENGMDPEDPGLYVDEMRVEDDTIMECIYTLAGKDDDSNPRFMVTAIKPRDDKLRPNQWDVCEDNWDLSHDPLPEHTITGKGTILMRYYHNDIKRELLSGLAEGSTLLDIGSGRGGDLSKWYKLSKVIAVEPIDTWLDEFRSRLQSSIMKDRVHIVHSGAEDVDRVIAETRKHVGRVDAISFMLSLTFFWQSELMVRNIAYLIQETLKPGGKVIFITMDGDAVKQHFSPGALLATPSSGVPFNRELNDEYIHFSKLEGGKYLINLVDSNVLNQEEYAVHVSDLARLLGGTLNKIRADKRRILNPSEKILSNMYSYGEITLNEKQTPISKPERAVNIMTFNPAKNAPSSKRNVASPPAKGKACSIAGGGCGGDSKQPNLCSLPPQKFLVGGNAAVIQESTRSYRTMLGPNNPIERIPYSAGLYVYRIDTIGDGSCFIHAALQGCSHRYADLVRDNRAIGKMVGAYIRMDIARYLTMDVTEDWPTYMLFDGGRFPMHFTMQLERAQDACDQRAKNPTGAAQEYDDREFEIDNNVDASPWGIYSLFRSTGAYLGDEAYDLFAGLFGIDVYVFEIRKDKCVCIYTTAIEGRPRYAIMVGAVSSAPGQYRADHYETMGVEDVNTAGEPVLMTVFPPNSPLFTGIEKRDASVNVPDELAVSYFERNALPHMLKSIKRLKNSGSSFSVIKACRPWFHPKFDEVFTLLMRAAEIGADVWPDKPVAISKSEYPPCFYGQSEMLEKMGIERPTAPKTKAPSALAPDDKLPAIFSQKLPTLGDIVLGDDIAMPIKRPAKAHVAIPL